MRIPSRFTTTYTYDSYDRMITQTYPSGKVISYSYNAQGEMQSISIDGTPFISDIKLHTSVIKSPLYHS